LAEAFFEMEEYIHFNTHKATLGVVNFYSAGIVPHDWLLLASRDKPKISDFGISTYPQRQRCSSLGIAVFEVEFLFQNALDYSWRGKFLKH
jgi:hypothetical protein